MSIASNRYFTFKITQTDWKNFSFHAPASAQHNQSRLLNERTWEMMMNHQLMANLVQSRDPSMWVCDKALSKCALELRNIATYLELNLFLCSKWSAVDNMLPFTQTEMRGVIILREICPTIKWINTSKATYRHRDRTAYMMRIINDVCAYQ